RAEQLQRSARLVRARHPLQGEERDLDQSGVTGRLGLRRQRDGQVLALHRHRRRVPELEAALPLGGPAHPLAVAAFAVPRTSTAPAALGYRGCGWVGEGGG